VVFSDRLLVLVIYSGLLFLFGAIAQKEHLNDSFQTEKTIDNPELSQHFLVAQHLLKQFRRCELSASDVFEVKSFAQYIALCDLFGASYHPLHTNQFRFYYNPVLSRLEPIPFDINGGDKLIKLSGTYTREDYRQYSAGGRALFLSQLFQDKTFWETYIYARFGKVFQSCLFRNTVI